MACGRSNRHARLYLPLGEDAKYWGVGLPLYKRIKEVNLANSRILSICKGCRTEITMKAKERKMDHGVVVRRNTSHVTKYKEQQSKLT